MQIAQVLSGYTLGGADMLRRAMGKKKPEEMAKQRSVFAEGAEKNGITDPGMTLAKAFEAEPQLPEIYEADEEVKALIDMARKLEGVTRNAGKHAGGVVIAPTKIADL